MTARVLVVDDVLPNVKLLEAKLASEYFDVLCATSGPDALEIVQREQPDIVLLDVMMPGMNGFEVCRHIKSDPKTNHIPVIMVTALDQMSDKVAGLEAGAEDFLTKPVDDIALFARVKSLVRLKVMMDELKNRENTGAVLGWVKDEEERETFQPSNTSILYVDDNEKVAARVGHMLSEMASVTHSTGGENVADRAREKNYDLVIVSLSMRETDGLWVCSKLRSYEETRNVPILVVVDDSEQGSRQLVRALEMGVNDYLIPPVERLELMARARTQVRRKRYSDRLWENFHLSMQLATTDAVTGLYNRHYMNSHLETLLRQSKKTKKTLSLVMLDIDHFKPVNDTYGHAAGDEILHQFARRIARNIRGVDLAARFGGEEFVVIMPDTLPNDAGVIADRLRQTISDEPFIISGGKEVNITVSLGLAFVDASINSTADLLERADAALYQAKHEGRNRVVIASAA
ncbi:MULTISPECIES: PleD family two-component system response regulator [unclassified Iodidimonas]|jgi:two-component system cell cycle response regulator|uniref:PleD family two-component system response regulator n=1 Tax=unclassified Iodidimonas TaxID=2626145 RepID=UPI0024825CB9|nr:MULTISPECIES: PleD family two-component system response regulator [unclassified Iodidimonas]